MSLNPFGIASSVFLALYTVLFAYLLFGYATKRFTLRSRWTLLLFHVTIRLAAQAVGIAFAVIGYSATGLLVASLVLSAEGYFSLMLCLLRLLISWQRRNTAERHSWLAGPKNPPQTSTVRRIIEGLTLVGVARTPINFIHWVRCTLFCSPYGTLLMHPTQSQILITANVLIIVGGSLLAGGTKDARDNWSENSDKLTTSKAIRGAGQGVFLSLTLFIFVCVHSSLRRAYSPQASADERRTRNVLLVLACTAPFMIARGVFGLLQAVVDKLNVSSCSYRHDAPFFPSKAFYD